MTRKLVADSIYHPSELKIIGKAFDDAWAKVAHHIGTDPHTMEAARLKLAEIVLTLARHGRRDGAELTQSAVHHMLSEAESLQLPAAGRGRRQQH